MIGMISRLFARRAPVLSEAGSDDAATLAALHAACFHRGWSEREFEQLLLDRNVIAHRALVGRHLVGFILSRFAAGEAEILSVGVAVSQRGEGLGRRLLELHLRRLAALGTRAVFLEVDAKNTPARRLYDRAGFSGVGRREAYYATESGAAALILRRDLV
jgi:[ribosomal protein S18]-alanine N-acetyltransferase